ncbi:Spartin [Manis pentadactyla]|nr:Spartin [Manis pentadactyla]
MLRRVLLSISTEAGKQRTARGAGGRGGERVCPFVAARTRVLSSSWLEPAEQEAAARRPLWAVALRGRLFRYRLRRAGCGGASGLPRRSAGTAADAIRPTRAQHGLLQAEDRRRGAGPVRLLLRRAHARAPVSRVGFFVPAHARPILTDRVRPSGGQSASASLLLPAPSCPARASPFLAHVVSASGPGQFGISDPLYSRLLHFQGRGGGLSS